MYWLSIVMEYFWTLVPILNKTSYIGKSPSWIGLSDGVQPSHTSLPVQWLPLNYLWRSFLIRWGKNVLKRIQEVSRPAKNFVNVTHFPLNWPQFASLKAFIQLLFYVGVPSLFSKLLARTSFLQSIMGIVQLFGYSCSCQKWERSIPVDSSEEFDWRLDLV